jgi:DNA-binding transcriptional LysR family regulator
MLAREELPTALATGSTSPLPLATDSLPKPSFTLEQLRTFLAVGAREHVTRAAKALGLSQAAVTQQVQLLERALGVRLLQRVGRNIRLTDVGREVATASFLVMRSIENLTSLASAARDIEQGVLAVGASEVAASHHLPARLAAFAAERPAVRIVVVSGVSADLCEQVSAGDLDCALAHGPLPKTALQRLAVAKDEFALVAPRGHPLSKVRRVSGADLSGMRYLASEPGNAVETLAAELLGPAQARLCIVRLPNLGAVRQALLSGLGFALLPTVMIADDVRAGLLITLPARPISQSIYAVRRPFSGSLAAEAFWPYLSRVDVTR